MTEQSMTIHEIVKKLIGEIRPVGKPTRTTLDSKT
jgi:hypothetical protein